MTGETELRLTNSGDGEYTLYGGSQNTEMYQRPGGSGFVGITGPSNCGAKRSQGSQTSEQPQSYSSSPYLRFTGRGNCDAKFSWSTVVWLRIVFAVFVGVFITTAAVVTGIILSNNSEKEHTLPNIVVADLRANLTANVSVPNNMFYETDLVNLTQPDGNFFLLNPRLKRKKRQAGDLGAWSVSVQSAEGNHMTLTFHGLPATCTSAGNYSIILMSGNEAIFEVGFTIMFKNAVSSSGRLARINEREKSFRCEQTSECLGVGLDIYGNGETGQKETLKGVSRQCTSTYSNSEGYKDECIGKTNYSAIACGPLTSTPHSRQFLISECDRNPCQHDGSCHVPKGGNDYTCTCIPGYEGHDCEIDINECLSNPCRNGASCTDIVNGYTCACKPGYTGVTCSKDINECIVRPCLNEGVCQDHVNGFTCRCKDGFTGSLCETDIDECSSNPCSNGGSCTDGENSYTCQCRPGYTGKKCDTNIDECASNPCKNGGKCKDGQNGLSCDCELGFTGSDCGIDIDECSSNPCSNGGSCTDGENSYTCQCRPGYTGKKCDTNIDECASNPCKNGGKCKDGQNGLSCDCELGFTGSDCGIALPGTACRPDVTCVDHAYCDTSGVCRCTDPYITSDNNQQCSYLCSQKCPNEIGDAYSNAGDVCGSKFKRCVNGTLYIEQCNDNDVFDTTPCVCVRHSQASWCVAGISETKLQEVCASECSKSGS